MAMKEQELPNNTTAEQALLGALLIDPDAIHRVSAIVQAGDFYQEHHSWLYAAILSLANHDTPPDFVNVCDLLERRDQLQGIGQEEQRREESESHDDDHSNQIESGVL